MINIKINIYYIYFFLIQVPLFLNLDFSQGSRFDVNPFNSTEYVSLPLSVIIVFLIMLNIKKLLTTHFIFIFLLLTIYLMLNFLAGTHVRAFINYISMLFPLVLYYSLKDYYKNCNTIIIYKIFYRVMSFIVLIKFSTDILFFNTISSTNFVSTYIAIYNYYDYYPFFYVLLIILSLYNLERGINKKFSLLMIFISFPIIFCMESRTFEVLSLFIIFIIYFFKFIKIPIRLLLLIVFLGMVLITLIVAAFHFRVSDASLYVRFEHWDNYFSMFKMINIFFPSFVVYRQEINFGTFHNEALEQFSYFGIIIFYYYYIIIKFFSEVTEDFKAYSFTIATILFIASLLQSNLTNPFLAVVWTNLLLIFKANYRRPQY